jgi:hypothetical protein
MGGLDTKKGEFGVLGQKNEILTVRAERLGQEMRPWAEKVRAEK